MGVTIFILYFVFQTHVQRMMGNCMSSAAGLLLYSGQDRCPFSKSFYTWSLLKLGFVPPEKAWQVGLAWPSCR